MIGFGWKGFGCQMKPDIGLDGGLNYLFVPGSVLHLEVLWRLDQEKLTALVRKETGPPPPTGETRRRR